MLSICRSAITSGSVAVLILEHSSLGGGFKLILRRTQMIFSHLAWQEIKVTKKKKNHTRKEGICAPTRPSLSAWKSTMSKPITKQIIEYMRGPGTGLLLH